MRHKKWLNAFITNNWRWCATILKRAIEVAMENRLLEQLLFNRKCNLLLVLFLYLEKTLISISEHYCHLRFVMIYFKSVLCKLWNGRRNNYGCNFFLSIPVAGFVYFLNNKSQYIYNCYILRKQWESFSLFRIIALKRLK